MPSGISLNCRSNFLIEALCASNSATRIMANFQEFHSSAASSGFLKIKSSTLSETVTVVGKQG